MSYIMVDMEADGPIPSDYSMVSIQGSTLKDNVTTLYRYKKKKYLL